MVLSTTKEISTGWDGSDFAIQTPMRINLPMSELLAAKGIDSTPFSTTPCETGLTFYSTPEARWTFGPGSTYTTSKASYAALIGTAPESFRS